MLRSDHDTVPRREFHVSRRARARYRFEDTLFTFTGNVVFANFHAARVFAQRLNAARDVVRFPDQAVSAGQINALGLIDEILHVVIARYREERNPEALERALRWLDERVGRGEVDRTLRSFVDEFPPLAVYRGELDVDRYLAGQTGGTSHRAVALEELLLLWLANLNPAFAQFRELFDDTGLVQGTASRAIVASLHDFFDTQPPYGPDNQNLIDMLRAPALAAPDSLEGQLAFMRHRWGYLIGAYLQRLLGSLDLIAEELKSFFVALGEPGPAPVLEYRGLEVEPERFSPDQDWMPRLVLLAKNVYVWLDQLSKECRRPIRRLDEIPEGVLETLARRGFTGLWLIGLWERSPASQRIKQLCGNPDAVASAYSLFDYRIAADLGGDAAYQTLRDRARARGIRLASDMVPNHMGIDSRWVIEHPDWFISLDSCPFPSYTFDGPDLSWDARVGIFLEDHYYTRSDAAVVFKRLDRSTGQEKYIYHGNDGTRMPWNDTAQLNYLRPDVREAVIQTILHVARQFPIIRFDAAMTLAKRHYQRLWFPEPGTGGDIPSRAGLGLTKAQFDAAMPNEFWREVVDRVAVEAPDTLLLAEAFWLMEGYFVRTLGMHRVYNSAFMNMLRDEENAKYRQVMKNTLEFDPEILRRYVNFMNNPDERTAVDQFGKGDKYFGICTMLATLPGLPMFGHGQIEGLTERYGMEFRRAYWDEQPDEGLIQRHEAEIFPLLHRRYLFAGVENFRLYDFFTLDGTVNEDVFAYSNRFGEERALVVYHNRYAEARGWIRTSVAYAVKSSGGEERSLAQVNLGEGLGLRPDDGFYCILRDQRRGLEYLRNSRELHERGLYVELGAYQAHVFGDVREVQDDDARHYARLAADLNGRGVPSVDEALREMIFRPVLDPFAALVSPGLVERLREARLEDSDAAIPAALLDDLDGRLASLLEAARHLARGSGDVSETAAEIRRELVTILRLPGLARRNEATSRPAARAAVSYLCEGLDAARERWGILLGWLWTHALGRVSDEADARETSRAWIDEWLLGKVVAATLRHLGEDEATVSRSLATIKLLTVQGGWWRVAGRPIDHAAAVLETWLRDPDAQHLLRVNRYDGILWYNKEAFEDLLWWMLLLRVVEASPDEQAKDAVPRDLADWYEVVRRLQEASDRSGYRVEKLLTLATRLASGDERREGPKG